MVLLSDDEYSLTELAHRRSAAPSTVHREAQRLEAAGVIQSRRVGNVRLVVRTGGHLRMRRCVNS